MSHLKRIATLGAALCLSVASTLGATTLLPASADEGAPPDAIPTMEAPAPTPTQSSQEPQEQGQRWWLTQGAGELRPQEVFVWGNGTASTDVEGAGLISVRASAEPCEVHPQVEARVDDRPAGIFEVTNEAGRVPYDLDGFYPQGKHRVTLTLLNDRSTKECDLNLRIYGASIRGSEGNPFAQGLPYADADYIKRMDEAARSATASLSRLDRAYLHGLARRTNGVWLGSWTQGDKLDERMSQVLLDAANRRETPVFVVYGMGGCLGKNPKSLPENQYAPWLKRVYENMGASRAVVILEPDALPFSQQQRCEGNLPALQAAVEEAVNHSNVSTYVDAGHPRWLTEDQAREALTTVGAQRLRGFSLNVANTQPLEEVKRYGDTLARDLNLHYVVDTSRNGGVSTMETCNPEGVTYGEAPQVFPYGYADALLWIKVPGESDGSCRGAPPEGEVWLEEALNMARAGGFLGLLRG